jgi:nitrogen regulatory protein PII
MKMIAAVVQPFMLTKVTRALEEIEDFPGMTIFEVQGYGREKAHPEAAEPRRHIEDVVDYVNKTRIEIAASDEMAAQILRVLRDVAHTGNRGDGKIFVWSLETAIRIRTGETGDAAL